MIEATQTVRQGPPEEIRQLYRNVFGTKEGRKVLGDIMVRWCHFGLPLESEQERIEHNLGLSIGEMSGIMSHIDRILGIGSE